MGKQILLLLLSLGLATPCFARSGKVISCANLLEEEATPFNFAISDLEGLYMDLVEDAAELTQALPSPNPRQLEVFFKKKAEFFNRFSKLVFLLRADQREKLRSQVKIKQLALMSYYLGVAPGSFGFTMNEQGEILLPLRPVKNSIGFLDLSKVSQQEDEEVKAPRYSIGFSPVTVKEAEVPARNGGGIEFMELSALNEIVIGDFEKQKILKASSMILRATEVETEEKRLELTYSQTEGEWIIAFQSKVNPNGQMGFVPVKERND